MQAGPLLHRRNEKFDVPVGSLRQRNFNELEQAYQDTFNAGIERLQKKSRGVDHTGFAGLALGTLRYRLRKACEILPHQRNFS